MCGILGVFGSNLCPKTGTIEQTWLKHRGPDYQNSYVCNTFIF